MQVTLFNSMVSDFIRMLIKIEHPFPTLCGFCFAFTSVLPNAYEHLQIGPIVLMK